MWGILCPQSSRSLALSAKRCMDIRIIVPTVLYGSEAWGRRIVNVLCRKWLRSMVRVTCWDTVRHE